MTALLIQNLCQIPGVAPIVHTPEELDREIAKRRIALAVRNCALRKLDADVIAARLQLRLSKS